MFHKVRAAMKRHPSDVPLDGNISGKGSLELAYPIRSGRIAEMRREDLSFYLFFASWQGREVA